MEEKTEEKDSNAFGCTDLKATYDQCFDQWYAEVFLAGKSKGKLGCKDQYKVYQECLKLEIEKRASLKESIDEAIKESPHEARWHNNKAS